MEADFSEFQPGHGRLRKASLTEDHENMTIGINVVDSLFNRSRMWSRDKFTERIFAIRDYYQKSILALSGLPLEEAEEDIKDPFQTMIWA